MIRKSKYLQSVVVYMRIHVPREIVLSLGNCKSDQLADSRALPLTVTSLSSGSTAGRERFFRHPFAAVELMASLARRVLASRFAKSTPVRLLHSVINRELRLPN